MASDVFWITTFLVAKSVLQFIRSMNSALKFYFPFGRVPDASRSEAIQSKAAAAVKSFKWRKALLPFDGSCQCSKGSDLTLEFDDGSTLKTHVALLKMASSIFEWMLRCDWDDWGDSSPLRLENTTRDAWLVILNQLHPKSPVVINELNIVDVQLLEDVGRQAKKFDLELVWKQIDSFFCILLEGVEVKGLVKRFQREHCTMRGIVGSPLRLELPLSEAKISTLADEILHDQKLQRRRRQTESSKIEQQAIRVFLDDVVRNGSDDFARLVSLPVIEECFSP